MSILNPLAFDDFESFQEAVREEGLKRGWTPLEIFHDNTARIIDDILQHSTKKSNLVIVALPAEDDYIYQISSQKVPHLTLLYLGNDSSKVKNLSKIVDFVDHAAERSLTRFGMEVDRRGELGEEKADVLFFKKSRWSGWETLRAYRSYLLKDDNIRAAYDATEQFPEFIPHLTLGTSDAPAKPDKRDYPGTTYVNFDRIAVWVEEFDGPEFALQSEWDMWETDVAMSNLVVSEDVEEVVEDILQHFGKKGMKWGVRNRPSGPQAVTGQDKGKKYKTKGGGGHKAVESAVSVRKIGQQGKKSGVKSLTDHELQAYAKRIQLEQNVSRLMYSEKSRAAQFVDKMLGRQGSKLADKAAKEAGTKAAKSALNMATRRSIKVARIAAVA